MKWLIIGRHIALSSLPLTGTAAPSLPSPWLPGEKGFSMQAALADPSRPAWGVSMVVPAHRESSVVPTTRESQTRSCLNEVSGSTGTRSI